jgi:2-haloacid dehalogenase
MNGPSLEGVRALVFDVFGTLVDWRAGVARDAQALLGLAPAEAGRFADDWRGEYQPAMEEVRAGRLPFSKLDVLHRRNLDRVLARWGLDPLEGVRRELNLAWHRLDAWPDVTPALARLRLRFRVAPCSNGHIALMVALSRRNGWHWDAILGAELARDYKPKAAVYLSAAAAFDCAPHEVMMVAAHASDLEAAAAAGLRTAFVARPDEHGPGLGEGTCSVPVDASADDLDALADRLD